MSLFVSLLAAPAAAPARPVAPAPQTLTISGDDIEEALFGRDYDECFDLEAPVSFRADSIAEKILSRTKEFPAFNSDQKKAAVEYLGNKIEVYASHKTFHNLLVNNRRWHDWECHSNRLTSALTLRGLSSTDIFDLKVPVQELHNAIAAGKKIQPAAPVATESPPPKLTPKLTGIEPKSVTAGGKPVTVTLTGENLQNESLVIVYPDKQDRVCYDATGGYSITPTSISFPFNPRNITSPRTCQFSIPGGGQEILELEVVTPKPSPAPRVVRPAPPRPAPAPRPAAPPPPAPAPARPTAPAVPAAAADPCAGKTGIFLSACRRSNPK